MTFSKNIKAKKHQKHTKTKILIKSFGYLRRQQIKKNILWLKIKKIRKLYFKNDKKLNYVSKKTKKHKLKNTGKLKMKQ